MKVLTDRHTGLADWAFLAFVVWFGSYAYLFFYAPTGFKPLYSYFLLLLFTAGWLLYVAGSGRMALHGASHGLFALLGWLSLYLAYGAFEYLRSTQDPVATQTFITLGEAVLLTGAFALFMADPGRLRMTMAAFAGLALLGAALNLWDFFDPVFSNVPGRAAGLYVNPNIAGHFIAMAMAGGVQAVRRRWRTVFVLVCGIGVLLTFSRAAWILWGLAVLWLGWQGRLGNVQRRFALVVFAALIGGGFVGLLFAGSIGPSVARTPLVDYLTPNTEARLGIGASVLSGYAAEQRESLIGDSIHEATSAPWLGRGLGYTTEWRYPKGPHDMYLLFLVEGGVLGAALYVALMVLLWRYGSGVGRVVAMQLIAASFFTHNQLEQPAFLMMMAFVVAHGTVARSESSVRVGALRSAAA